ncbi:16S rRNA (cytosine(1402)-N(4))-methyltransferase RsmH [Candidatus Saccharibacteria bacterium]|nr:16S rRNA (cytosine(1402)-N(4))-methyltransferase RsmH [Candidatus Saccharibacteria bacterium]MCL1962796.1 16S rRNA (cytosine(1402)-N(4))-methyltransferase RsmH [Candidatus Saccharibacteria bacterium]
MTTPQQLHIPVLLDAVLDLLKPAQSETYLDLTAGYGGHAREVIARIGAANLATLVDRDEFAISQLEDLAQNGARVIRLDFLNAAQELSEQGEKFDMILLDLGVSSPQLDRFDRGFSFRGEGVLDMRMDQSQDLTAAKIVNRYSEKDIFRILTEYGEERSGMAAKIAHAIATTRKKNPFMTTTDLAELVKKVKGGWGKIHPATQTFQAVRIAVNDELGQLERVLPVLPDLLNPGGRLAIISFHSLEDRIVKNFLKDQCEAGFESIMKNLTKHPISGDMNDVNNPRARSAKLRAAVKTK